MFSKRVNSDNNKTESDFAAVCRLAQVKDRDTLNALLCSGVSVNVMIHGEYSPVMVLAQQGDDAAVSFLIRHFNASMNQAVVGFACGKHVSRVEDFLARGANIDDAVFGYARAGMIDKVNDLLQRGASIIAAAHGYAEAGLRDAVYDLSKMCVSDKDVTDMKNAALDGFAYSAYVKEVEECLENGASITAAMRGYARGGFTEYVEELIVRGAELDDAMYGYACAGFVERVEDLFRRGVNLDDSMKGYAWAGQEDGIKGLKARGVSPDWEIEEYAAAGLFQRVTEIYLYQRGNSVDLAVAGYKKGGFFDHPASLLRLLALTDDARLRGYLAYQAAEYTDAFDVRAVIDDAVNIVRIMQTYALDFEQAKTLLEPGLRGWLLQGRRAHADLPHDLVLLIAMQLINTSQQDMHAIYAAVARNTHDGAVQRVKGRYGPGLFDCFGLCKNPVRTMRERDLLAELESKYQGSGRRL